MSNKAYDELWTESQRHLKTLFEKDKLPEPLLPERDRRAAFKQVALLYLAYIKVARALQECYDNMIHPQKRRVVRQLLDGTVGRVIELKTEMVTVECTDFHFMDDLLISMKLSPKDMELPIPWYFLGEKTDEVLERDAILQDILDKFSPPDSDKGRKKVLNIEEAVKLIQVHERARQGRLRSQLMREIRKKEEEEKLFGKRKLKPTLLPEDAAIIIQKIWKGYSARKKVDADRIEELILLGMMAPATPPDISSKNKLTEILDKRHEVQKQHERDYKHALITVKEKLAKDEGPLIKERLQDEIRGWFNKFKQENDQFPVFPDVEDGGSALIFSPPDPQLEAERKKKEDDKKKKGDKGKKDKKKEKGGKDAKKKKDQEDEGFLLKPSNYMQDMVAGFESFKNVWHKRNIAPHNPHHHHEDDLIKQDKYPEVEAEIRLQVDELMRIELDRLTTALNKDRGKKGKKKKKKKKRKKKGGKKGKKEKDLTPDRTLESLYEELVEQGIIKDYPKVFLSEFLGETNHCGSILLHEKKEPIPCLGDIRRLVSEYCVHPLGSPGVHSKGAFIKSILFVGPPGTGKKTLVYAICTETGATLFDISAENIAGKYPGKPGLNMLLHLVSKVGRRVQPSVIYIRDAEKTFLKKVPKTDKTDPKRLKKDLPKLMKGIGLDDRLLLCGVTHTPFDCDMKGLGGCYQKIILIPKPDYGCRRVLWTELITRYKGIVHPKLDISTLTLVSDGFTPAHVTAIVQQVLTARRIAHQHKHPLMITDFSNLLCLYTPIYDEEEESYRTWFTKTPLGKKRVKLLQQENGENGDDKKKKDAKKKK